MEEPHRASAERVRAQIESGRHEPSLFQSALLEVPITARDAWLDLALGLAELPDDGPELPSGCVPYLPCAVDDLLQVVKHADVRESDVFVDVGAGVGRAVAFVQLWTGSLALGLEVQPQLVQLARALTARLCMERVSLLEGDATELVHVMSRGTVFFLYCPFSGARLRTVLAALEAVAHTRTIRICCVDLPLPPCAWLSLEASPREGLAIYRSRAVSSAEHERE